MEENMSVAMQIAFLAVQLGVILFAARFCGEMAQKIKIPSVLGELLAGIIIGPYLLGSISLPALGLTGGLFPLVDNSALPVSDSLYGIATLGSIMLLFMSGLETDLRMFFRYSLVGTLVGIGGVIFSFGFAAIMGMMLLHTGFMDPRCLFLGILCTATSVGITARILSEKKSLDTPEGTTIMAAAVIDDVLGIICLAVVMGIIGASGDIGGKVNWENIELIALKSVGIWLGVSVIGLIFAHQIAKFLKVFRPAGHFAILAFGLSLLMAGFFEKMGLAMIVGAYVMGLSLSKTDIAFSIQSSLQGLYDFLVPIFFVVMGMLLDIRVFTDSEVLIFGLIYSVLAIAAKIIGCALPSLFMNFNWLGATRIGMGMIPRGEVALIIAGIGATTMMTLNGEKVPIVNGKLFGVAIIMTLLTTLIAPPLLAMVLNMKGKGIKKSTVDENIVHTLYKFPSELISYFILHMAINNFKREGFFHSEFDKESGITHFRRATVTFTLQRNGNDFDFESVSSTVMVIKSVMYETLVDLYRTIGDLKVLNSPEAFGNVLSDVPQGGDEMHELLNIDKIIPLNCIVSDLKAASQDEAIIELLQTMDLGGHLRNLDVCIKSVLEREHTVSTYISNNISLPHGRTNGTSKLMAAIGISSAGFKEFGTSGELIKIVILVLTPEESEKPYMQFIAHVGATLKNPKNLQTLLEQHDPVAIRNCFAFPKVAPKLINVIETVTK